MGFCTLMGTELESEESATLTALRATALGVGTELGAE